MIVHALFDFTKSDLALSILFLKTSFFLQFEIMYGNV